MVDLQWLTLCVGNEVDMTENLESQGKVSRPKHIVDGMYARTVGNSRSANSEYTRGRIEKGEQLQLPGGSGGGEWVYGRGDKT